ncbi:MAG: hypothetical protein QT11_C0001G0993 [archaeon GW2011_AR20]|nr:MAG: hypothetical protein QT11_C0001G0993 [archaeon GW2011_AR20]MBS3161037.1 hypothetical protein [Candidatus Woesearchaeota archaeon]
MKLKYFLPFFVFFGANAQFKIEANRYSLDTKSSYVDIAVRDTFGLEDFVNIKGDARLKYGENALYVSRNGLLNHSYGTGLNVWNFRGYFNHSLQNLKTETTNIQESPIGRISVKNTLLDDSNGFDFGFGLDYKDYFVMYEDAEQKRQIDGETLIKIEGQEPELIPFEIGFQNSSELYSIGFKYGFFKFIKNKNSENKFYNYFIGAMHKGLNVYYGNDWNGFFIFNIISQEEEFLEISFIPEINLNLSYDKKLKLSLSTGDYSKLDLKKFERTLEDRLRAAPRIHDINLEILTGHVRDMFFTDLFGFYLDKDNFEANLNFHNLLAHYSKDSKKIGLKYDFAIVTYDIKQKELKFGVFIN